VEFHAWELQSYTTPGGKCPFDLWLKELKDRKGRWAILTRLERFEKMGNPGHCRAVGMGVQELKIDIGPGYRVYYGLDGNFIVVLLCGGDKSTQKRDIREAQARWVEYRSRE